MTISNEKARELTRAGKAHHRGHNWDTRTDAVQVLNPAPKLRNANRHRRLKRVARALVAAECAARDLISILLTHNGTHCEPPLPERIIQQIAVSAFVAKEER